MEGSVDLSLECGVNGADKEWKDECMNYLIL